MSFKSPLHSQSTLYPNFSDVTLTVLHFIANQKICFQISTFLSLQMSSWISLSKMSLPFWVFYHQRKTTSLFILLYLEKENIKVQDYEKAAMITTFHQMILDWLGRL